MGRFGRQLRVLLWKNYLLKIRHPVSTLLEVLLPASVMLMLMAVQTRVDHTTHPASAYVKEHAYVRVGASEDSPTFASIVRFCIANRAAIAFVPNSTFVASMLRTLNFRFPGLKSVAQMYPDEATLETYLKSREYGVPGGSGGGVPGGRGGGTAVPRLVKGAVVFHSEGPQKFDYSLRLNHTWAPSGFPDLSSIMDTTGGYTNDLQLGVNLVPTLQYGLSGFYSIQQVMDAYIIFYAQRHRVKPPAGTLEGEDEGGQEDGDGSGDEAFERGILDCPGFPGGYMDEDVTQAQSVWTGGEDLLPQGARGNASKGQLWRQFYDQEIRADEKMKEPADRQGRAGVGAAQKSSNGLYTMLPQSISVAPFPTPKYTDDHFQSIIKKVLGILYVVAFLFPVSRLIRASTMEKETGIREGMRMMGLHNAAFHLAFFITYTVQFALSSAVITALAGGTLFKYSQKSVVFCFFLLFSESSIALCYLITPFFSRAKSAAAVGTLAFLGAYFPYYTVMDSQVSGVVRYLAALLSPTAFALGTINIADYERAHVGLRWSNVADVGLPTSSTPPPPPAPFQEK